MEKFCLKTKSLVTRCYIFKHVNCNKTAIFVEPTWGELDIVVRTSVWCMYLRHACIVCACVQNYAGHNIYIYAWISKYFGTVVLLGE